MAAPSGDHVGADVASAIPAATVTGFAPSESTTVRSQAAPAWAWDQYAKRRPSGENAIPPIANAPLIRLRRPVPSGSTTTMSPPLAKAIWPLIAVTRGGVLGRAPMNATVAT